MWQNVIAWLREHVPKGKVTTYVAVYAALHDGDRSGARAVSGWLNQAIRASAKNKSWTHRVVTVRGDIKRKGQLRQLRVEGIPIVRQRVAIRHAAQQGRLVDSQ